MRMHNKGSSPVAFAEYRDMRTATDAMNRLQGFILLSSERGGIRIEYSSKAKIVEPVSASLDKEVVGRFLTQKPNCLTGLTMKGFILACLVETKIR